MSIIRKALEDRSIAYFEMTQKTLALFSDKLNKAVQYFMKLDRDITWISLEPVPGADNFVFISGLLEVQLNDIVIIAGERVRVDEDFIASYKHKKTAVQMILTIEELETLEPKDLFEKIKDFYEVSGVIGQENLLKALGQRKANSIRELMNDIEEHIPSEIEDILTPPAITKEPEVDNLSFDLSLLTEDQRAQMKYHSIVSKLKN